KDVVLKFKADNGDGDMDRDVRFVIHDLPIYEIDQADFENPNVMNAMFYNIQMLPFGVVGMGQASERAALLPAQLSEFQDVVMFAEVFDTSPRENDLAPAMEAAGFIHRTTILNDPGLIPFPWNGGVMIFSKWPIEADEEIDFEDCGQASQDCLANKGIKYAKVNKLGKRYHIFGTHMDAGGGADDLFARRSQMAEMRDFIADLNIPDGEPVILGGDFNLDPNDIEYMDFKDTMNPYIPQHIGFYESTFSDQFGRIIDHAWGDRAHLVATSSTNEVITPRSIEPELWESSEFSDHRSVLGRFVYPDVKKQGGDTLVCPGENLTLSVETDHAVTYQWSKDGTELSGETGSELNLSDAQEIESGNYTCLVGYDVEYGQWGDTLTEVFYPNGPDIVEARLTYDFGEIVIDQVLCEVGIDEYENGFIQLHPNPATDKLFVSLAESNQDGLLTIYTASGQLVYTQSLQNSNLALDVSEYESGLYLIEFASEKGQFHQRFVVY
ncbi:MAG: endonuclease/exonuclease/phosphatase family protein, partial [Flavobacteriales bacterium]